MRRRTSRSEQEGHHREFTRQGARHGQGSGPYRRATANWWIGAIALCALALLSLAIPAHAQFQPKRERSRGLNEIADRMNANTVILVTGNPGFIFSEFGNDLAAVLNNGDELRILPVISQGALQNIRDVRFLKGVDLGFSDDQLSFGNRSSQRRDRRTLRQDRVHRPDLQRPYSRGDALQHHRVGAAAWPKGEFQLERKRHRIVGAGHFRCSQDRRRGSQSGACRRLRETQERRDCGNHPHVRRAGIRSQPSQSQRRLSPHPCPARGVPDRRLYARKADERRLSQSHCAGAKSWIRLPPRAC